MACEAIESPLIDIPVAVSFDPEERLADLVRDHHSPLMAQALRLTNGDHGWAEDVVQETFIRAWRRLDRMTEQHGSVRSWLMRVAHNLAVDGHRSKRAHPVDLQEAEADLEPVSDVSNDVLAVMQVDEALTRLGHEHRAVLEEVYLRDHSVAEAAQQLDIPVGTVKSRTFYALRHLRAAIGPRDRLVD